MKMSPRKLLPTALRAIALGVEVMQSSDPGNVTNKGDRDMATEVDFSIERTIKKFLLESTPDIAFFGEEEGGSNLGASRSWVLDPVDGTANFLHGLPLYGVSLSLVEDETTKLGIIASPYFSHVYSAVAGLGSYCNEAPIRAGSTTELNKAIVSLGDYAVGHDARRKNSEQLATTSELLQKVQRIRMLGSAATDLAWVARGWLDACVILANKPWDTSAGVLIARESGAVVMDIDGTQHSWTSSATIAAAPGIADAIIEVVHGAAASAV
jgi:myo-inositol-1(or 4)-monophosphatase